MEQIWQDYRGSGVFQVLALDMWNGSPFSVQGLIDQTGFTFPVLRNAGYLQSTGTYGIRYDNYVLVDADGIVRYTSVDESFGSVGRFNDQSIRAAIEANLPVVVAGSTWGGVKALFR